MLSLARRRGRAAPITSRGIAVVAATAVVAVVAALVAAAPRLTSMGPGPAAADLGVELPPAPAPTAAPTTPPPASPPTVPVRCRTGAACLRWRLPPAVPGSGAPALAGGRLVVPTATGLLGYGIATGAEQWRTEFGPADVAGPTVVTVAGTTDAVAVADRSQRLSAVDATDGTLRWQQPVAGLGAVRAAQAVADGWLIAVRVQTDDEPTSFVAVIAVDAETGATRWQRQSANAALTGGGAVLQDVNGTLTGLSDDGTTTWEVTTGRPAASLTPVGDLLLVGSRDVALVVDVASGDVLDEIVGPPSQVRADAGAVIWPVAGGIAYRSGDGVGWRADVDEAAGCCNGFVRDPDGVTVLTGRGELIRLAADDGALLDRRPAPASFDAEDGRAWLYGRIALAAVPGSGGLARLHDTYSGRHLADITSEAYALLAADDDTRVVLSPGFALTLPSMDGTGNGTGRPVGSARVR